MSSPLLWSPVFSRYQGSNLGKQLACVASVSNRVIARKLERKQQNLLVDMSAASSSSLPPLEDRFSVILSRLDRTESSLKCLEDIKKVLVEIEGNTHPDSDGKSVYRKIVPEKVRSRVPRTIRRLTFLRAYSNKLVFCNFLLKRGLRFLKGFDSCSYTVTLHTCMPRGVRILRPYKRLMGM